MSKVEMKGDIEIVINFTSVTLLTRGDHYSRGGHYNNNWQNSVIPGSDNMSASKLNHQGSYMNGSSMTRDV